MAGLYNQKQSIEKKVYTLYELASLLGWEKNQMQHLIESEKFDTIPFKVLHIGNSYCVSKKQVDNFLESGRKPTWKKGSQVGRKPKWKGNNDYCNINIPIENSLYDEFKECIDYLNSISVMQTTYREGIYVAMQEFVQRRPIPEE